jgi:hypothetical protein
MSARLVLLVGFAVAVNTSSAPVSAEIICEAVDSVAKDIKRHQCWPEPFIHADRSAARAPFAIQVSNGWRRQNMLGEFHFEPSTGQLTEAGRRKVRWIVTVCPAQHRLVYVHAAETEEETAARVAVVQQLVAQMSPGNAPPVMSTSISDDGWPADQVEIIGRKFQATMPAPRLPNPSADSKSPGF